MEIMMSNNHNKDRQSPDGELVRGVPAPLSRHSFLGRAAGVAAATATAGALGALPLAAPLMHDRAMADTLPSSATARADRAYTVRVSTARDERARPLPDHPTNGDDTQYASTRIGSYTKGLPHNALGEVDPTAYAALLTALQSGRPADFEAIPLGGQAKLAGPQSAFALTLEGADSGCLATPVPPSFSSVEMAGEMAEMYWYALARDVPFASYGTSAHIATAAADLSRLSAFGGPKAAGAVTPDTIFRLGLAAEMSGPYVSQFQWLPVPYGAFTMDQRYPVAPPAAFMTTYDAWLAVQNGIITPPKPTKGPVKPAPSRSVITGRDMALYLINDFSFQGYLNAMLILASMGAPLDKGNPYTQSRTQVGIATFGTGFHGLDLVTKVANTALKTVHYQKWLVHRRARPEEFGGRVHNHKTGAAQYPIHADLLTTSTVLDAVFQQHGSYLLPMPVPRGCPQHPSYPAAHSVVTGACITLLKAWFDESYVLPAPVVASADGSRLLPYTGASLTVGGELNKLAANHCVGRSFGGFHFRSDLIAGLLLGEAVAISVVADERATYNETFTGLSLTKFDGTAITV
jgi:hypothetical protein